MGSRKGKSVPGASTVRREMNQDQLRLVLPDGVVLSSEVDMRSMSKARVSVKMMPKVKDTVKTVSRTKAFNKKMKPRITGEGRQRRYSEDLKLEIGKMVVERGYRATGEHFSRKFGFKVYGGSGLFANSKRAYLKKMQEEGQNVKNGGVQQGHGGMEQVNGVVSNALQGEVFATNQGQEEIMDDADEEGEEIQEQESVGEGSTITSNWETNNDPFKEGDYLNQVKEQGMESEEDEDLVVHFDSRAVFKETPVIADMKKYEELQRKIQLRKEETRLLEVESEELSQKLARELVKGRADAV